MIEKIYNNFVKEAEMFFVKLYLDGKKNGEVYRRCLDVIYNVTGNEDHGKGIVAVSPKYGQGKSFFFEVVQHRNRRTKGKNAFVWTTARELCEIYTSASKDEDPMHRLSRFINVKNLMIDDIGDELKDGKERSHYSNKLNVVRFVLLRRYELWIEKGWRTFGTTNLTIKQIAENYDGRAADRLKQMVHWEEFDFLQKGSFRQMKNTRKLTQEEIGESWEKISPEKIVENVDTEKFFNELIQENDEYIQSRDLIFWDFVREYLIKKNLLTEKDFEGIDEQALIVSETKLTQETKDYEVNKAKWAPIGQQKASMEKAMKNISKGKVYETAKAIIAKRKFLELRKSNHKFK